MLGNSQHFCASHSCIVLIGTDIYLPGPSYTVLILNDISGLGSFLYIYIYAVAGRGDGG